MLLQIIAYLFIVSILECRAIVSMLLNELFHLHKLLIGQEIAKQFQNTELFRIAIPAKVGIIDLGALQARAWARLMTLGKRYVSLLHLEAPHSRFLFPPGGAL